MRADTLQDLTSRYRTRDLLPKLRAFSHEWDDEIKVGGWLMAGWVGWVGGFLAALRLAQLPPAICTTPACTTSAFAWRRRP